jgi:hypothetical protein
MKQNLRDKAFVAFVCLEWAKSYLFTPPEGALMASPTLRP